MLNHSGFARVESVVREESEKTRAYIDEAVARSGMARAAAGFVYSLEAPGLFAGKVRWEERDRAVQMWGP